MVRNHMKKESGFTLVELLIVVAIIGVLSTVGIPTFRRMIQKSKKSEAKVELGGLYTSESAFFAEYGGYGNHLARVGFQIDGAGSSGSNSANLIYAIGFADTGCLGTTTIKPAAAGGLGANITTLFPAYYTTMASGGSAGNGNAEALDSTTAGGSVMGNDVIKACDSISGLGTWAAFKTAAYAAAAVGTEVNDVWDSAAGFDSDHYVAGAWGVISPGGDRAAPASAVQDIWAISDTRVLVNLHDGIK